MNRPSKNSNTFGMQSLRRPRGRDADRAGHEIVLSAPQHVLEPDAPVIIRLNTRGYVNINRDRATARHVFDLCE